MNTSREEWRLHWREIRASRRTTPTLENTRDTIRLSYCNFTYRSRPLEDVIRLNYCDSTYRQRLTVHELMRYDARRGTRRSIRELAAAVGFDIDKARVFRSLIYDNRPLFMLLPKKT